MKLKINTLCCIGIASAAMPILNSCKESQPVAQKRPDFPATVVTRGNTVITNEFSAEIESRKVIEIRSRATGYISKMLVKEGSEVKKGQTIAQIDPEEYQQAVNMASAAVLSAEASLQNAKLEVEKLTPLVEKNIVSKFQLETAQSNLLASQAALKQAKANLRDARINLSYTTIKSPVSGVIGRLDIFPGSLLQAGGLVTEVSEKGDAFAYFSMDEKKFIEMTKGIEGTDINEKVAKLPAIEFVMVDGTVYPEKGHLEVASGIINKNTGSIQLKGVFPNPQAKLRSGSSGKIRIPLEYNDVLIIPKKSTFELQDKKMVYKIVGDSVVRSKAIDVIGETEFDYTVGGGIAQGDTIVLDGLRRIKEGDIIEPVITTSVTDTTTNE